MNSIFAPKNKRYFYLIVILIFYSIISILTLYFANNTLNKINNNQISIFLIGSWIIPILYVLYRGYTRHKMDKKTKEKDIELLNNRIKFFALTLSLLIIVSLLIALSLLAFGLGNTSLYYFVDYFFAACIATLLILPLVYLMNYIPWIIIAIILSFSTSFYIIVYRPQIFNLINFLVVIVGVLLAAISVFGLLFLNSELIKELKLEKREVIKVLLANAISFVLSLVFLIVLYITAPVNNSKLSYGVFSFYLVTSFLAIFFLIFGIMSLVIFLLEKTWSMKVDI